MAKGRPESILVLLSLPVGAIILAVVVSLRQRRRELRGRRPRQDPSLPAERAEGNARPRATARAVATGRPARIFEVVFGVGTQPDQNMGMVNAGTMEVDVDRVVVSGRLEFTPADGAAVGGVLHLGVTWIIGWIVGAVAWVLIRLGTAEKRHVVPTHGTAAFRDMASNTVALQLRRKRWLLVAPARSEEPVAFRRSLEEVFGPEIEAIPMGRMGPGLKKALVALAALAVAAVAIFVIGYLRDAPGY